MSVGTPCVVTDVGAARELVEDGRSGCVVPRGDAKAVADALSHLVGNELLRAEMGADGMKRWESAFSIGSMIGKHVECYLDLAGVGRNSKKWE
jgi:glycosyltransferase involved in cell wall biosynthesis